MVGECQDLIGSAEERAPGEQRYQIDFDPAMIVSSLTFHSDNPFFNSFVLSIKWADASDYSKVTSFYIYLFVILCFNNNAQLI